MAFFQEQLDDEIQWDACHSFEGGMVSNEIPRKLAPNQAALMVNMDIPKTGEAVTRRGTALLGAGFVEGAGAPYDGGRVIQALAFFNTASYSYLVAMNNGYLWKYTGGAWSLLTTAYHFTGFSPYLPRLVQGIDKLYIIGPDQSVKSWDGATIADLGSGTGQPPLGGTFACWHTSRLIISGVASAPDTIYFSDILGPTSFVAANSLRVGGGENDPITNIKPWLDFNLLVTKGNSIWIVNCDPTLSVAEFEIKPVHHSIGTAGFSDGRYSAAQVGSDMFVVAGSQVRSIRRTLASETQTEVGDSISTPIDDLLFSKAVATDFIYGFYHNNHYFLSTRFRSTSIPMEHWSSPQYALVVYNRITQTWCGIWTGVAALKFCQFIGSDGETHLAFGGLGKVYEWLDYVSVIDEVTATYQDAGLDIPCELTTRAMNFNDPTSPKTGLSCEVEYTSAGTLTGQLIADGTNAGSAVSLGSGQTRKAFDVQSIGQFRELQLDIVSTAGKQQIRNIQAGAFSDSLVLQS